MHFAISGIYIFLSIIIEIYQTIKRIAKNVFVPLILELGFDAKLFMLITLQGIYDVLSSLFLRLSKITLYISKTFHQKSESIIQKHWELY